MQIFNFKYILLILSVLIFCRCNSIGEPDGKSGTNTVNIPEENKNTENPDSSISRLKLIKKTIEENKLKKEKSGYETKRLADVEKESASDLIITFLMKKSGFKDSFHIKTDTAFLYIGQSGDMLKLNAVPTDNLPLLDSLKRVIDSIPRGTYRVDSKKEIFFKIKYGDKIIVCYGCYAKDKQKEPLLAKALDIVAKSFQKLYRKVK